MSILEKYLNRYPKLLLWYSLAVIFTTSLSYIIVLNAPSLSSGLASENPPELILRVWKIFRNIGMYTTLLIVLMEALRFVRKRKVTPNHKKIALIVLSSVLLLFSYPLGMASAAFFNSIYHSISTIKNTSQTIELGDPTPADSESEHFKDSLNLKYDKEKYLVTSYKRNVGGSRQLSWVAISSIEKNSIVAGILDGSKIVGFFDQMKRSLRDPDGKSELQPITIQGKTYSFSRLTSKNNLGGNCNRVASLYTDHITTVDNLWIVVHPGIITEKCDNQQEKIITSRLSPEEIEEVRAILESIDRTNAL